MEQTRLTSDDGIPALSFPYLAGLLDGEGCIMLYKAKNKHLACGWAWQVRVQISQSNPAFIDSLKSFLGYGSVLHNVAVNKQTKKLSSRSAIIFASRKARRFLKAVFPHLILKREEAKLCLEAIFLLSHRNKANRHSATDDRLTELAALITAHHSRKGPRLTS